MAYRLKSVRYQASDRNILLQNENGPCPLLAAANALLLRGAISLPPECIRTRVASIEDVVNVLAERCLGVEDSEHSQHHLNELLSIFPKLQYGMDVNPKFTAGPTGVEYTSNLTAFDLLSVDLVHGWLLDPQDSETHKVIGTQTYNQLIEHVIRGQEASSSLQRLREELKQKELQLEKQSGQENEEKEQAGDSEQETKSGAEKSPESSWIQVQPEEGEKVPETDVPPLEDEITPDKAEGEKGDAEGGAADAPETDKDASEEDAKMEEVESDANVTADGSGDTSMKEDSDATEALQVAKPVQDETKSEPEDMLKDPKELELEMSELRKKMDDLSIVVKEGNLINSFLSSSSHQLTHYGLHELYDYVSEASLSVFFRNNHFATLTKHDGVLYLLVTDLGYANVPEVLWEKLDGIDGDTEYVNSDFVKPAAQAELTTGSGPNINPEQMLAQRGQSEADYQLALELSKHQGEGLPHLQLDDQEGKLVAAATEASLREFNGVSSETGETKDDDKVTASPTLVDIPHVGVPLVQNSNSALEDQDRVIAMQLQAQMEREEDPSERLALQLQAQENRRAVSNNNSRRKPNNNNNAASKASDDKSSCVIS